MQILGDKRGFGDLDEEEDEDFNHSKVKFLSGGILVVF